MSSAGTSIMSNEQIANEAIYHMISRAGMRPMGGAGAEGLGSEGRMVGLSFQNELIKILVATFVVCGSN